MASKPAITNAHHNIQGITHSFENSCLFGELFGADATELLTRRKFEVAVTPTCSSGRGGLICAADVDEPLATLGPVTLAGTIIGVGGVSRVIAAGVVISIVLTISTV